MTTSASIALSGLIIDIVGFILLWKFGLLPDVRRDGQSFLLLGGHNEKERKKAKLYDKMAILAVSLIVAGFALQAVAVLVSPSAYEQKTAAYQEHLCQQFPSEGLLLGLNQKK